MKQDMVCIPGWQHKFHIVTEILSITAVPMLWMAANKIGEPHALGLKALAVAIVIIDGGLILRWMQLKYFASNVSG